MKVVVIIPAAGLGTRMAPVTSKGKSPSKQFTELGGTPILIHTIRKFAASPKINEIVVALRKDEMPGVQERLRSDTTSGVATKTRLVEGGEHRQHSVANALATVSASTDDVVLVHDAVRPFVTEEIVDEVIRGAEKFGAAIAGVPAVDTVKKVERTADGALITATIPREHVVMAQTPQGFRYDVLKKAFDEAAADGFLGTDEASLV
jgi:2-C-methyl-D-erythritol 4-phosphate cytidylyltransferase